MSSPQHEGGESFEDSGRDPRLELLNEAAKRVALAEESTIGALEELRVARVARRMLYEELTGQVLSVEGRMKGYKDQQNANVTFADEGALGSRRLTRTRAMIVGAVEEGVWVTLQEDGRQIFMDYDGLHHPQDAPPKIDL